MLSKLKPLISSFAFDASDVALLFIKNIIMLVIVLHVVCLRAPKKSGLIPYAEGFLTDDSPEMCTSIISDKYQIPRYTTF